MKILYISQYFPPEMGAPAGRASELSRFWVCLLYTSGLPNIIHTSSREIVDDGDLVPPAEKVIRKMRADEASPTRDQNAHETP